MKYKTFKLLDQLHSSAEQHIHLAITEWQQLPTVRLTTQPAQGSWSAIECVDHLVSYGRYYLPAMEKAIANAAGTALSPGFNSSFLGNYFYKLMLPQTNGFPKKKMRSPKNHLPTQITDPEIVINEFISQLEKLQVLIRAAYKINISKAKVPISIAKFIKLSLGDTLLFYVAHISRHMLQAQRALQTEFYRH